jgi:hypothetical protein
MTLLEIYNNVAGLVYGDIAASPPPVHEITTMQTLILAKHRECQLGYNFWFQLVSSTLNIVTGTDTYNWPADFKELISTTLSGYTTTAAGFKLSAVPTADTTADIKYWSIIQAPAWTDAYTDAVTLYLNWYIIFSVVGDMMLKRSEKTEASVYYQLADAAIFTTEQQDYHRRQVQGEII